MNFRRTSGAVLVLSLSITAAASYLGRGAKQETQSSNSSQSGDVSRQALITNQLQSLLTPAGIQVVAGFQAQETQAFRQVRIHWETPVQDKSGVNTQQLAGTLTVKQSIIGVGGLPRRRALELADTEVLVIAVDETSRLMWWNVMTDPRLLRAESVNAAGEISGGVSYLPQVDFAIAYPDDPRIKELRLYHPEWTGREFRLTPLGVLTAQ